MKEFRFKHIFATPFKPWTKNIDGFSIPEHVFSQLYHACTHNPKLKTENEDVT